MAGESGVTRSMIGELHSSAIQGDEIEGESGVIPSMIDELHSLDIQRVQMEGKTLLLEVSLMNFILGISN